MVRIMEGFDGYMLLDDDATSDLFSIGHSSCFSVQIVVEGADGSAAGELTLELSNDKSNWVEVPWIDAYDNTAYDGYDIAGTDFTRMVLARDICSGWGRLVYTRSSGTGGLSYYLKTRRG